MTGLVVRTLLRYVRWLPYPAAGVAVIFIWLGFVFHRVGELDSSVWEGAAVPARVVPFVLGVVATPILLPVLVAHGITRTRFVAAAGVTGGLVAAATGLYMIAGFLVERAAYAAIDVPQALRGPHLFDSAGQLHLVFAEHALLAMAYQLGGFLVGTGYYGYGGWLGSALLLPGALVAVATDYLLGTGWVAAALAVIALGLGTGRVLIRPVAIRTRRLP